MASTILVASALLLILTPLLASAGVPQGCTAISSSIFDTRGKYLFNGSVIVSSDPNSLFSVVVDKYSAFYGNPDFDRQLCVYSDYDKVTCITDFSKTLKFSANNSTGTSVFQVQAVFNRSEETYGIVMFQGSFDERGFNLATGELFSEEHPCVMDEHHGQLWIYYWLGLNSTF